MLEFLTNLDLSNPYICLGITIVILFILLAIFMPEPEVGSRSSIIIKILLYFGIPSAVLVDIHSRQLKNKYITTSYKNETDEIFKISDYEGGNSSRDLLEELYG